MSHPRNHVHIPEQSTVAREASKPLAGRVVRTAKRQCWVHSPIYQLCESPVLCDLISMRQFPLELIPSQNHCTYHYRQYGSTA